MYLKILLLGTLLAFFVEQSVGNNKCYEAKTCVHNGDEKCGEDRQGNVRRFLDTCDLKEYNCLRGTDYVKADPAKCKSLPPIEHDVMEKSKKVLKARRTLEPGRIEVVNKYWCWRAKYCKPDEELVCGVDRRTNKHKNFQNPCAMYKHNCDRGQAFLLLPFMSSAYEIAPKDLYENPKVRKNFMEFHCFKLKSCTAGGPKVCGYDEHKAFLAEFEDRCTLHKANCQGKGYFVVVDKPICDGQKFYEAHTKDLDLLNLITTAKS